MNMYHEQIENGMMYIHQISKLRFVIFTQHNLKPTQYVLFDLIQVLQYGFGHYPQILII